jgi:predicted TIM-barrel fold metal-dependent hydrolase
MRRDAPLAPDRHSAPKRDCTVEEYLAVLDANGISHGVLTAPSFYGADKLTAAGRAGSRRRAVCGGRSSSIPAIDRASLAAMGDRGAVGIRLNWVRRSDIARCLRRRYRQLFANVRDLDWACRDLSSKALACEGPAGVRENGAQVVVDHFGSPDPRARRRDARLPGGPRGVRAGDTFVKLSAPYRQGGADPRRYVDALLDAGGPQQLVWASDWPFVSHEDEISYRDCVQWLADWVPTTAARASFSPTRRSACSASTGACRHRRMTGTN